MTLYGNSIAQAAEHWLHFSREADIIFTRKSSPHSESYYGRFHLICTIAKRLTAVSIATVPRHSLVYSTPARRTNTSRLVRSRRGLTSYPVRVYTRRVEPTTSLLRHRRTSSFADKHTHTLVPLRSTTITAQPVYQVHTITRYASASPRRSATDYIFERRRNF